MKQLFSFDGWYYRVFSFLADMIMLSFLFMLPAMTIIFAGPALIALYQTVGQLMDEKELPLWRRYQQAFSGNLTRGFQLTAIVLGYVLAAALIIYCLMAITPYFGVLSVILVSLAGLFLTIRKRNAERNSICSIKQYRQRHYIIGDSDRVICSLQQSQFVFIYLFRYFRISIPSSPFFQQSISEGACI